MSVRLESVTYIVSGREILSATSLTAKPGEILAVMGLSGAGKSTLLKCVAGLVKPSSGRILLDALDIVPLSERRLTAVRHQVGYVFQYAALFDSLTVFDNVSFGLCHGGNFLHRDRMEAIVRDRLTQVGMEGSERLMPSQLSGGMQKRVGLARALATDPKLLLYDEPTSGLDPITAHRIDDLIVRTRERLNVTSIVVSHNLESVFRIADRVAMIHDGVIRVEATPDEVRSSTDPLVSQFIEGRTEGPIHSAG